MMTARFFSLIQKQPVLTFYILAFAITWIGWVPQAAYSRGLFPFDSPIFYVLGGVGPLLAVLIVLRALLGRWEYGEPFRPYLLWRAAPVWYAVALLGCPAMWLAAVALSGGFSSELARLAPLPNLLFTFLIAFLAAVPEEVAWRGFVLPRLQTRYSALVSSLIMGILWGLWHLPLLFNNNNLMSTYPLLLFLLDVIARSVIYVWLFNSTRGSLLFVTLFHAASNTVGSFVGIENLIVTYLIAAVLLLVFGKDRLAPHQEAPVNWSYSPR